MGKFRWEYLQGLALVAQLGLVIVGPALVGLWLGRFLALYTGYTNLLAICGMLLGLTGGMMQAYKLITRK